MSLKAKWKEVEIWAVEPGRQISSIDNGRIVKIGDPCQTEINI